MFASQISIIIIIASYINKVVFVIICAISTLVCGISMPMFASETIRKLNFCVCYSNIYDCSLNKIICVLFPSLCFSQNWRNMLQRNSQSLVVKNKFLQVSKSIHRSIQSIFCWWNLPCFMVLYWFNIVEWCLINFKTTNGWNVHKNA